MRYPDFLQPGGRIGFIAPSFAPTIEPYKTRFEEALKIFRGTGFQTVLGPNCAADCGLGKSNTPEACAAEINDFFQIDRCDVIISCGGGETMCEDLSFVDFEALKAAKPKWYMGYSDNTNLVHTLVTLCDTAAIYGPHAADFGMNPWHDSITDAFMLLCGTENVVSCYNGWEKSSPEDAEPLAPFNITEPFKPVYCNTKGKTAEFSGRLIGGCLDVLQILCGTRFDRTNGFLDRYAEDGVIWVIEACDLNPMAVRRALWQLESAGWFRNVKGFLIGRPRQYDDDIMGMNRLNAVTGILEKYGVPVLLDLDIGHMSPAMPLIMGSYATVKAEFNDISVRMELI